MFHNGFPLRKYAGEPLPDDVNFLDFAIHERPKYIPNSIPICKATPMLPHDKDGIILDFVLNDGDQRYIVGFKDSPDLRVSVKMMKIRDWVSARTFEEWHWQKTKEEEQRLLNTKMHWTQRKQLEKALKNGGESREAILLEVHTLQPGMGLTGVVNKSKGPGRRRKVPDSQTSSTSRRLSTLLSPSSKRGRGQISQTSQMGLAQIPRSESGSMDEEEDEDDDEDEYPEIALAMQLNDYEAGAQVSKSDKSRSTSVSVSVELPARSKMHHVQSRLRDSYSLSASITNSKTTPSKHQSRTSRHPTPSTSKISTPIRPSSIAHKPSSSRKHTPTRSSVPSSKSSSNSKPTSTTKPTSTKPSTSSFSNTPSSSKPKMSQTKLKTFFLSNQTLKTSNSRRPARKRTPTPIPQPEEAEEEEEEEAWNVERILDDETRIINEDGTTQTYYLIKWEGEYDNTWEPSENVGSKLKKEYKKIKQMMKGAEAAKSAEKKKRKRRESEDRSERGTERKRRTTTSRSRSPLFMNDEDMDEEQDEIAVLPSPERHRQTITPVALRGTKSAMRSRSKSKTPSISKLKWRSVSQSREHDNEGDTNMYNARHETPEEERGLFVSRTPPTAVKQKAAPIDLRSSSEAESEHGCVQKPDQEEKVELSKGNNGVVVISSDEESD